MSAIEFNRRTPALIVVDDFYREPDSVCSLADSALYVEDGDYYKGGRSQRYLFPYVREEFERLIGARIEDWTAQPYNGCFQKTTTDDVLVWHSDTQNYAGAVYLSKGGVDGGTSFWRDKKYLSRRPPFDHKQCEEVYSEHNLTHAENWELVDTVGSVFNRLVLWDAKLIHSATSYQAYSKDNPRLVQLFFFNVC